MASSKDLVKRAIEFRNPERVPHNINSNRTPVVAERYGEDFEMCEAFRTYGRHPFQF